MYSVCYEGELLAVRKKGDPIPVGAVVEYHVCNLEYQSKAKQSIGGPSCMYINQLVDICTGSSFNLPIPDL
jgi:hypothetical protein